MKLTDFCKSYFNGFQEALNYKKNNTTTNVLAALKVLSYFTIVIPLGFATVYGSASLYGRISQKEHLSSEGKKVDDQAKKHFHNSTNNSPKLPPVSNFPINKTSQSKIIQTSDSKKLHNYTGDLTELQKLNLKAKFNDDDTMLEISFQQHPTFNITIRKQDIFNSDARVIINAANTHLGGGGGIDGAIHKAGGKNYQEAHKELQTLYKSEYISGHAAMIESGLLAKKYNIDNVIVVAGPQGATSQEKENELYSCYYNSLVLANSQNKISIAFPSISTGIFRFPRDRAAHISLKAIHDFINQYPDTLLKTISIHFLPTAQKNALETYRVSTL